MKRGHWAEEFLERIDAPKTKRNVLAILCIIRAEGDSARCNPLNTTLRRGGSTDLPGNSAGVQEYPDFKTGLDASAETLNHGAELPDDDYGYRSIRFRFRHSYGAHGTLKEWEQSAWGTGGLGLIVLASTALRYKHYRNLELRG